MVEHEISKPVSNNLHSLLDNWTLWAHLPHDINWDLNSYIQICDIETVEDATKLIENLPEVIIKNCMLFLMRKGIHPTWEDPKNISGGCFSFKINNKFVYNCWKNLSYVLLGETLVDTDISNTINGITISPKKNFCIIKIWLANCENNNPNIICDIENLPKMGCLFKKHLNESE
tara:strand:+ start:1312 stop:1833 length:522 start_codon:yes stop_codon:yes gene_type:complete